MEKQYKVTYEYTGVDNRRVKGQHLSNTHKISEILKELSHITITARPIDFVILKIANNG